MVLTILVVAGVSIPVASPTLLGCVVMRCVENKKVHSAFTCLCTLAAGLCFLAASVLYALVIKPLLFMTESLGPLVANVEQQTGLIVQPTAALGIGWICALAAAVCLLAAGVVQVALIDEKRCKPKPAAAATSMSV